MSLPHALLGLLNYRPATGYELKGTFTKSIHFFWNATLPQIYRTLKQTGVAVGSVSPWSIKMGDPAAKSITSRIPEEKSSSGG